MPKITVPSKDKITTKWGEETPKRAAYYESEAPAAADLWFSETQAAGGVYKAAIGAPTLEKMSTGGVKRVGAEKFKRKVTDVGAARFGPGVTAAIPDFDKGIDPFLAVLAATTIKERGPRGDPSNYDLVKQVGDPLHKKRLAIRAAIGT